MRHGRILPAMTADLLAPLREAPEQSALIFDVDGTVVPIVPRPKLAAVPAETRAELERLAARYLLLAFVSGRPGREAEALVRVPGARYVGNHGLELDPRAAELAPKIAAFRAEIALPVEDKGLTLAYHYRLAEDEVSARRDLEAVAARAKDEGLIPRWGRKVLEVRPDLESDKGTAVRALVVESGARSGLYAGDDTTDLDAFHGLADARLEHFVRVAVLSDEAPVGLAAAAEIVVAGPKELRVLLARL
jgi:trehalose 6-phosphate phosphatase